MDKFKNIIFKILISFGLIIIALFLLIIFFCPALPPSDYCLEDGDCEKGRIIFVDNDEIILNKNTCNENNWKWFEKSEMCKIPTGTFKVKKVPNK